MLESENVQKVLAVLPTLQGIVNTIHHNECERLNKDVTHTSVIVDVKDASIACVRVESGAVPCIRLSGAWTLEQFFGQTTENIVEAIRRSILIAHKRLRWTLGKNRPRIAAEYVASARAFRLAQGSSFSLPPASFRTRLTVTMTDPRTGTSESVENVRLEDVERIQRELAQRLTAVAYAHAQVAEVLDILAGQQLAANDPAPVETVDVEIVKPTYVIETLNYTPTVPLEQTP